MEPEHQAPEMYDTSERRQHSLTPKDLEAIADLVKLHSSCNLGITPDQASTLKRILNALDAGANVIGKAILVGLLAILFAIFTKGFWIWLANGIHNGGGKTP